MTGAEGGLGPILDWLAENPAWAGAVVGLIAFLESLALVGLAVPGAALLFMAGAVVGGGNLAIAPILAWGIAGAILGDSLSYWLGRRFRHQFPTLPLIRRYPGAIVRAQQLFQRHGGKSVIIGRFVGPVRPVIPAVVGMLGMPPGRFLAANVFSALLWAPAYILPGILVGASVVLALEVMGRLVAWVLLLLAAVVALRWLLPRVDRPLRLAGNRLARWLGRHPPPGWNWLGLRPLHEPLRALRHREGWLWWSALIAVGLTVTLAVTAPSPHGWEKGLLALADAQRDALLQQVAWRITQLGGWLPVSLGAIALGAVLWAAGEPRRAALALLAVALPMAISFALKGALDTPRPGGLTDTAAFGPAFPSAHSAGIAALVTAWMTLLPARGWRIRTAVMSVAAAGVVVVALSRVVLGVHWPLDVIGGAGLGVVFGVLPGLTGPPPRVWPRQVRAVLASALVVMISAALTEVLSWPDPLRAYPDRSTIPVLALEDWHHPEAPPAVRRLGLAGKEEPLAAHWLGGEAGPAGFDEHWYAPPGWTSRHGLAWLGPDPAVERLPALPRWHAGRLPEQVLIRPVPEEGARLVLRAWRGAESPAGPIWLIQIEHVRVRAGVLLPRLERNPLTGEALDDRLEAAAQRAGYARREAEVPRFGEPELVGSPP